MPPYLAENHQTVTAFLEKIDPKQFRFPFDFEAIHSYLDSLAPGDKMIKAALDIALHDLWAKIEEQPLWKLLGTDPTSIGPSACTLGIADPEVLKKKVAEAADFINLKVKLGSSNDRLLIETIRQHTDKPLFVDVNGGWTDREFALDMSFWLQEQGVVFLEQPFEKTRLEDLAWLNERSPLPVFADESCQVLADVEKLKGLVSGINIKLMKCGGIYQGLQLFQAAQKAGLQTLLGCMTETSCATFAALSIADRSNYVDIDGPWMLAEQPFRTPSLNKGIIQLAAGKGLGLENN